MSITRIKNNQITDATITNVKIASGTLTGDKMNANLTFNSNLTLNGNLVVTGNVTAVQSTTTQITDPLLTLGLGNAGTSYDLGLVLIRGAGGNRFIGWKENESAFVFISTTEDGLTTGNIATTAYSNVIFGNMTTVGTTTIGGITLGANTISAAGALTIRSDADSITFANNATFTDPVIVSSTLSVSGTATVNSLVSNGAIQGTTGSFSSNLAAQGLTVNTSAVITTTLQAAGGIQNTPIGNVTASSGQFTTVSATGNITGAALTSNGSITAVTTLSALGGIQATPIGNVTASSGQFTTVSATGNITGAAITSNASITAVTTISGLGGLQATPIGNVTPSTAIFTAESVSGNSTVNGLTVNNSATIGTTLGVTGNATVGNLTTAGNVSAGYFFGNGRLLTGIDSANAAISSGTAIYVTGNAQPNITSVGILSSLTSSGNITADGLTINISGTFGTTLSAAGGIQNTPIGNVTPSTALFTTVGASGNATVVALTVNGSATVGSTLGVTGNINGTGLTLTGSETVTGSLSAAGGLQATPIGNAAASTGQFTTVSATGNVTGAAITANGSMTVGTTLGVTGNATIGNISSVGRIISNDTTNATGTGTGAFIVVGGGSVTKDFYVGGNLYTTNLIATTTSNITVQDPLLYLTANTPYPYDYEIGFYSQFNSTGTNYQHTGFIRDHTDNVWKLVSNVAEPTSIVDFTNANVVYDSIKTGPITALGAIVANSTLSLGGNATINGLTVNTSAVVGTTLQAAGGLQNTPIGNVTPSTAIFTTESVSGNSTVNGLSVNNSATVGTTLGVVGNATVGNLNTTGNVSALYFFGNGRQLTGLTANDSGTAIYVTGNAQPNITSVGVLTTLTVSGNTTTNALTVNNSATVGSTLGVTGNINGTGLTLTGSATVGTTLGVTGAAIVYGGLQNTPIGNVTPSTALFTTVGVSGNATVNDLTVNNSATVGSTLGVTGNINGSSLTLTGSETVVGSLSAAGGLQATPIGNAAASTGQFTTLSATGNVTGAGLTSNGSITAVTTLSALGGLQATPIGNVTPSTAIFTAESVSGNSTVNGLTVNTSAVVGTTLQALAGIQNTPIGNVTASSGAFTTLTASGLTTLTNSTDSTDPTSGALVVTGGLGVGKTLNVTTAANIGNVTISNLTISSNITNTGITINPNGTGQTTINSGLNNSRTVINGTTNANTFVVSGTQVGITTNTFVTGATFQVNAKDSLLLPVGATGDRPGSPTAGMLRFNTSAGVIEWWDGSTWSTPTGSFTVVVANSQTGNGSATIFSLPVANASTAGTIVSINGVVQEPITAYAISGNTVTFTEAPSSTDVIDFRVFTTTTQVTSVLDAAGTTGLLLDTPTVGNKVILFKTNDTESLSIQANGTLITGNILPQANAASNIGSLAMQYNTVFAKATSAQYADLAEYYASDDVYPPGTVLDFGGVAEVTLSSNASTRVAGVVSTNPAYLMNSAYDGGGKVVAVALTGRVPCLVKGSVRKGDMMVSAGGGYARAEASPKIGSVIGKALENFSGTEGVIEVVVGRL